jgi:hypothetical protein
MKNVAQAGIAVQLMTFTDFPTETPEEKQATFDFIRDNAEYWSAGGIATFLLTGTSIIARNPERFGVSPIEPKNVDIRRAICYKIKEESHKRVALTEDCDASFDNPGSIFPLTFERPWAGGNDTLHSMIYYNTYDRDFFKRACARHDVAPGPADILPGEDQEIVVNGSFLECPFDLTEVLRNRARFKTYVGEVIQSASEPTASSFEKWVQEIPALPQTPETHRFWLSNGRLTVRLSHGLFQILRGCKVKKTTLREACAALPGNLREKFVAFLRNLAQDGLVSFVDPVQAQKIAVVKEEQVSRKSRYFVQDSSRLVNS